MINELRKRLKTQLGSGYYWKHAPKNAAYPYRVGSLASSYDDVVGERFMLYLDYLADGEQWSAVYDLIESDAGNGANGLNGAIWHTNKGDAVLFYDNMASLEDADKNVQFVRVTYQVKIFRGTI